MIIAVLKSLVGTMLEIPTPKIFAATNTIDSFRKVGRLVRTLKIRLWALKRDWVLL